MANKMLIDASHPEETRVVVTRGNRVEEFDFESASRKQLRGNIYLAKVTRVEPSLQAAFVDFGGNRHGFLAFSEIHPDYYQIPVADREALLAEDAARARRDEDDEDGGSRRRKGSDKGADVEKSGGENGRRQRRGRGRNRVAAKDAENGETVSAEAEEGDEAAPENTDAIEASDVAVTLEEDTGIELVTSKRAKHKGDEDEPQEEEVIEQMGGGDALEDVPYRNPYARRHYKIQEVIKRRQILLIQVVKEERGNKGAALTTYLSLAGRYSVLMPNTARGGGISRKITNGSDRKRLKEVVGDLEVPDGMGVILRTAGAARTKQEIKRDFEYLLRVWEKVRELTLQSTAPALVYEEGSLVKRAIRDLYSKDIDDIQVAGEASYREAKDFMRMLMPSHSKMVQLYREPQPLFARFGIEAQLDAMFSNQVTLRSGGYIVINQTEALVSIDVNSGRSTREHNIEDTALKTNLEAAEEVARQLRLRDLAGLVVIDFIDMEENRNNRAVERKMKDCLKDDRARIQIGRISHFGLLEMSRQRIRTGVLESSTVACEHCGGGGFLRATPSIALQLLRAVEDALMRTPHHNIIVRTRTNVALYVLNHKRANLSALEALFGVAVILQADETVLGTTYFVVERGEFVEAAALRPPPVQVVHVLDEPEDEPEIVEEDEVEADADAASGSSSGNEDEESRAKRGRRRRRRGGRERDGEREPRAAAASDAKVEGVETSDAEGEEGDDEDDAPPNNGVPETAEEASRRRRRRRRRGGRRNRRDREDGQEIAGENAGHVTSGNEPGTVETVAAVEEAPAVVEAETAVPVKAKRGRAKKVTAEVETIPMGAVEAAAAEKPKRGRKPKAAAISAVPETIVETAAIPVAEPAKPAAKPKPVFVPEPEPEIDPNAPKRTGWWAKAKQALSGE